MATSAEWVLNKNKQRIYAISHAKVVVRKGTTVEKSFQALEDRATNNEESIANIINRLDNINDELHPAGIIEDGSAVVQLGKAESTGEIEIPTEGWILQNDLYTLDIENSAIDESVVPIIAVSPSSFELAEACGLKSYCRTLTGILRLYAQEPPTDTIIASIALIGGQSTFYDNFPIASTTTPGLVRVGKGLVVDDNGNLTIDNNQIISSSDVVDEDEMLDVIQDKLTNNTNTNP